MNNISANFNPHIYGTPLPSESWPQSRGAPRILYLHKGPKAWGESANLSQVLEKLPHGAIAVDVGTGSGQMPLHMGGLRPDLHWALVSATSLNPIIEKQMIGRGASLYYCFIPGDLQLLADYYGSCSLVLDTYGAVTYDSNPDLVLLMYALLLSPGGTASMVVSTTKDETPTHVFTSDETLQKIADFLEENLGVTLKWGPKEIESQAKPGTHCTDFIFRMTASDAKREKDVDPIELYSELSELLRDIIGTPHVEEAPWYSAGEFQIVAKKYY